MSAGDSTERPIRHEEFSISCLRYLETRLGGVRRVLMDVAADLAARATPDSSTYQVEPGHVDQALEKVFREYQAYKHEIGVG